MRSPTFWTCALSPDTLFAMREGLQNWARKNRAILTQSMAQEMVGEIVMACAGSRVPNNPTDFTPELLACLEGFITETVDYMTINNLGDPERQHNVKWARRIIAKAKNAQDA